MSLQDEMLRGDGTMSDEFLESWENRQNSIVIFAGVFDPVHNGHLSAAKKALHYGDKVVFLPERVPQHKHGTTAYEHRLNMLRNATEDISEFSVLDYPNDHHWVIETFEWLKLQFPGRKFVWLIGSDVEEHIASWPGSDKLASLGVEMIAVISRDYEIKEYLKVVHGVNVQHIHRPMQKDEKVSSTRIRQNVKNAQSDLPSRVYEYIKAHKLYSIESSST